MAVCHCFPFRVFSVIALSMFAWPCFSSFYQADTMAGYCREYVKFIELENSVSQLEAGICSGYVASGIELMDLSGQLCDREKLNLDDVARQYVTYVDNNDAAKKHTATYVLVELLQEKYACEQQ